MDKIDSINNEIFGKSKAIHSPNDETIKQNLKMAYGSFIESTNENDKTPSVKRRNRWENCQKQIRQYLNPLVDLSELRWAYPTNGIHESIDWMCVKVKQYQVFEGEYRYSTFMKKPANVAKTVGELITGMPLYMSNPFSADGCFDERYDIVGQRELCPIYLDMAFAGTTAEHKIKIYDCVKEVFWSCSKAYGLGLLRSGVRFVREPELVQQELQGVGYFNHAIIDVFKQVTETSSVFAKHNEYKEMQDIVCKRLNLTPSDSFLLGTSKDKEWDRFKRENDTNRVCLTPAYEILKG